MKDIKDMTDSEVEEMFYQTLDELKKFCSSVSERINQLDEYRSKAKAAGDMEIVSDIDKMLNYAKPKFYEFLVACQETLNDIKEDGGKILTPDNSTFEREKAFVSSISSDAVMQREQIQRGRDERYEQMVEEAGPIDSPMSRIGK